MSYRVVILRTLPYWSVRVVSCNLNLAGNSFHCRSRTASNMTCNNLTRVADEEQNGPGLWEPVRRGKWFRLGENCLLRSSLHQYISNQHTVVKKRQLSLPATFTHTRELCYRRLDPTMDTYWENRFKVGSNMNVWTPNIWILWGS